MQFNPIVQLYIYINYYAVYVGCALIVITLLIAFFKRKHLGKRLMIACCVAAALGIYFVLWNFRIINVPYRNPDTSSQDKAQNIKTNQANAKHVDFKTYRLTYKPDYLQKWAIVQSVFYGVLNPATDQSERTQVNIELAKYLSGVNINSEVTSLAETKPDRDIRQEYTRGNSCSAVYGLENYTTIGKNDAGGEILKATFTNESVYLTDYMGTRLVLEECRISDKALLDDSDALKMLHNLIPFDINTADFKDPRY